MATKLYLHDAASTALGTLPATNAKASADFALGASVVVALTNKSMSPTIGVAQAQIDKTTLANTAAQQVPIGRWILDTPLAAQTFAAQVVTLHIAGLESNLNSNFSLQWQAIAWRPSTGAYVGALMSGPVSDPSLDFTTETNTTSASSGAGGSPPTVQDGDLLILEVWRDALVQAMATAYTNTLFYDGTTEDSLTTNAAYVNFANTVALFVPKSFDLEQRTRRIRANLVR